MSETALQELERLRKEQGPLEPTFWDDVKGVARFAGQGLSFGWADEATAALRTLGSDKTFSELHQEEQDKLTEFKERNPKTALTAELVAGLLIPGLGYAKGAMTLGRAAKIGAGSGALYGAGASEGDLTTRRGLTQRGIGGGIGAVTGGTLGPAAQKLGSAGSSYLRRRFGSWPGANYRGSREQAAAVGRMQGRLRQELELSDPQKLRALDEAQIPPSEGFRDAVTGRGTIADIPGMEGSVSGVTQGSSAARRIAEKNLENRSITEATELMESGLHRILRATDNADDMVVKIQKLVKEAEKPHYRKARGVLLPAELFEEVLLDPVTKGIYNARRANVTSFVRNKRSGFTEEDLMPAWDDLIETAADGSKSLKVAEIPTGVLQQLKIALGKKVNWAKTQKNPKEEVYETLMGRINEEAGKLNPAYKIANRIHEIGKVAEKSVIKGAKALGKSSDTAVRIEYNGLKGAIAKKAYRSGMLQEIQNRVGSGSLGRWINKPGNERTRNALKAVFPDEQSFNSFLAKAKTEKRYREIEDLAGVGGSRTVRTREDVAAWRGGGFGKEAAELGTQAVAVGPEWAAAKGVGRFVNWLRSVNDEKIATEAANILFTKSPQEASRAFDLLLNTGRHLQGSDRAIIKAIQQGLVGVSSPLGGSTGANLSPFLAP